MIIKLTNVEKAMLKKDYGFDKLFNFFDEIYYNRHKIQLYNPTSSNMINRNNEMLEYLKITEWELIDMLSAPSAIRKINNDNCYGQVKKKKKEKMNSCDMRRAKAIIDSFKFKILEIIQTEEPIEDDEEIKSVPEETISDRVKLNPQKMKEQD